MTKGIADSATSGRRFIDDDIAKSIGKLAEQIAAPDLPEQLLQFAGQFVAHDLTTMTRYSPFSKPEYLLHTGPFDAALEDRYLADYYRFDPFYRYWKSEERSGVICLRDVASPDVKQGRYVREFLAQLAISDEVGVFLPPVGRASVALFLERCSGKFRKHELAKLRRIYPVLAGLFQAHVGTLFGGTAFASETGSALSAKRPVLLTDQSGQEIFANAAWQALMAME